MVRFLSDQKKRVLKSVDAYVVKSVKVNLSENILFNFDKEVELLYKDSAPFIFETYSSSARSLMEELRAGLMDYEVPNVRSELGRRTMSFSQFVNKTTDTQIQKVVKDIFQENIGAELSVLRDKLHSEISKLYEGFTSARADMIARTEVIGARNMGIQEAMIQSKKVENKMWITSRDPRVRDYHQIDGQVVGVLEDFTLGNGASMPYPMDINERCVHIATKEGKVTTKPKKPFNESQLVDEYRKLGIDDVMLTGNQSHDNQVFNALRLLQDENIKLGSFQSNGKSLSIRTLEADSGPMASFNPAENRLNLNTKYFGKESFFDETLKRNTQHGWNSSGCDTIKSVIDHEMGHHYTYRALLDRPDWRFKFEKLRDSYYKEWEKLKKELFSLEPGSSDIIKVTERMNKIKISNYANGLPDMNEYRKLQEFIAEGFSDYRNGSNISPYSKKIGELIKEIWQ